MSTLLPENFESITPSEEDARLAREACEILQARELGRQASIRLQIIDGERSESQSIAAPASSLRLFLHLLEEMSQGNSVALIPTHAELTTQQAADLLHVSRPYLVKLLDQGKIPSRAVGKYRRVRLDDLMVYKRKDDDARARVLDQLTAEAQELGFGY